MAARIWLSINPAGCWSVSLRNSKPVRATAGLKHVSTTVERRVPELHSHKRSSAFGAGPFQPFVQLPALHGQAECQRATAAAREQLVEFLRL